MHLCVSSTLNYLKAYILCDMMHLNLLLNFLLGVDCVCRQVGKGMGDI